MSQRNYKIEPNLAAIFMAVSLIAVIVHSAIEGNWVIGPVAWAVYYFLGWFVNGFNERMWRLFAEGNSEVTIIRSQGHVTAAFLVWPMYLLFTGVYIPCVLLLRRLFQHPK